MYQQFRKRRTYVVLCLAVTGAAGMIARAVAPQAAAATAEPIVPLFGTATALEPSTVQDTPEALITRIADRVRDRHAREPGAYDHYLSWYWEERTVALEFVDRVAKGGKDITINVTSLAPLNNPNFRAFFRGLNTVAEYSHNAVAREIAPNRYTTTISFNATERRPLRVGDKMEFEFSPFLVAPKNGRKNYYGTTHLYIVGKGIVPWEGSGDRQDSVPLPDKAWLGGLMTLPYPYSDEPAERFKQIATNLSPAGAQPFMLGRRLHHTDFGDGSHSEKKNPLNEAQKDKLGPQFVARSCVDCHVNNGRALPAMKDAPMYQFVVKVGRSANGDAHGVLGTALQPQSTTGHAEGSLSLASYTTVEGRYADGTRYLLQKPAYAFKGAASEHYSVRIAPQLVGLGLLEAVEEKSVLALADPDDANGDGISGRAQTVRDPETGQTRLGRFGYKAGQARLSHQIAHALNSDMGVTTEIFPTPDGASPAEGGQASAATATPQVAASNGTMPNPATPELRRADVDHMVRYVATLGVPAQRAPADAGVIRGEKLFAAANCVACHVPQMSTSPYHPMAEVRSQSIRAYTDLLLHDMGPDLADNLGEADASGAEWRTPPLWGIGLTTGVSKGEAYLHDGRARTLEEAILWHGGEGRISRDAFISMPAADRDALIRFLKSL